MKERAKELKQRKNYYYFLYRRVSDEMEVKMHKDQVESKVRNILIEVLGKELTLKQVSMTDRFEEIGVNSLNFIKFIVSIESEFEFEFEDDALNVKNYENIMSLVNYVDKRVNAIS